MFRSFRLLKNIPVPEFTKGRFMRRENMQDADRARFFYWNLVSIAVTAIPVAYLCTAKTQVSRETDEILAHLSSPEKRPTHFDPSLFLNK
uniref:Transmembrane protein n=1 Tax=Chromera velia CCMP2878 TaxID=1169474 RepID=A0A0G4I8A6_9ALVE|mmetsp:Transcript_44210/g.87204  ORF Transcript_44210/g.87204 Transcript_44210/m.87204 type:complete len:90 (-) Transcript_44210:337-606(-)|eukprot:Cvel_11810.t1-p1 / transcript=Cvel_11810.t1 / gene=Cvel_11810 / organism=Chromera_velia_CCMP2878 / gene_product=hypothetical protein / transcript_product=hypothetical protein / location=Cvel_scaffold751:61273-63633(-) / protein_length=89 / sequence_SO=supercontig / SO=protein_coding / is_pseudo=false